MLHGIMFRDECGDGPIGVKYTLYSVLHYFSSLISREHYTLCDHVTEIFLHWRYKLAQNRLRVW